ncbi:hypothetical protein [Lactobacillus fermentum] [Lactiplantibacillus mudanjiangensis]|uniref:hypothetical protein n=1 Tax=Lactiplantibacillus mudanjiangensis TaxID=1296538 RepID=UPI001014554A|nr:hypothetical protein [Lactiplantibacillus mudanjiangensis]VDG31430.1 hypothetical protein [Lactobacillus fermentum] [Lactiplantibacillus mudanjiangensis]
MKKNRPYTIERFITDRTSTNKYGIPRYQVKVPIDKKLTAIGTYNTIEKARKNRDLGLKNLPTDPTDKMIVPDEKRKNVRFPTVSKYIIDNSAKFNDGRKHLVVQIREKGVQTYVGTYDNLDQAIRNRDLALKGLPTEKVKRPAKKTKKLKKTKKWSRYGKNIYANGGYYVVKIQRKYKKYVIGTYDSLEQAIKNRDLALKGLPTEKPQKSFEQAKENLSERKLPPKIYDDSKRYKSGTHYSVEIREKGKRRHVGVYSTLEQAIKNRDLALAGEKTDPSDKIQKRSNEKLVLPSVALGITDISSTLAGDRKAYKASVSQDGVFHHLGTFDSIDEAKKAQKEFKKNHRKNKPVDLTGQVFGHLTVIKKGDPYVSPKGVKKVRWLCRCDCGRSIQTFTNSLTSGQTKSCGHARLDYLVNRSPIKDLTGKVFGHLKVIKDDGTRQRRAVKWLCQCDCGKQTHVLAKDLKAGTTKSCGHVREQVMKKSLADYREKYKHETPGTRLDLLGKTANKNSQTGERNISIVSRNGREFYRVAVVYKRHQYGGLRDTMEEAKELREELRRKYWPNYPNKK